MSLLIFTWCPSFTRRLSLAPPTVPAAERDSCSAERALSDGRSCLSCQRRLPAPSARATCRPHWVPVAWQRMEAESKSPFAFDYPLSQPPPSSGCRWIRLWCAASFHPSCIFSSLVLHSWGVETGSCRNGAVQAVQLWGGFALINITGV